MKNRLGELRSPLQGGGSALRVHNNEFEQRRETIVAGLRERKLDALLVVLSPNLRYLSGFTGSNGALLITEDDALLLTDSRYQIQASQECSCRVRIAKGPLLPDGVSAITRFGVKRIGYEPARMTCEFFEGLAARLARKVSLVRAGGWIEELRMVKSQAELALIRRSVATNSQAFEQTVPHVKVGVKEQDLAAELEYRMRRLGAEKPSFETIVATGERSALPHAQPGPSRLERGLVVIDMGAMQEGYASDMTRMLHAGVPGAKVQRMYKAVQEAQLAAIDAVHDGVGAATVDRAARRVLKGFSLDRAFTHSTGHGLGLEIHEPPRLGRKEKTKLKAGMTVTIEPGVYVEGFGGIRIEDTVLVTENGCEILTPTSKELRIV